jgi:hypothetical protein
MPTDNEMVTRTRDSSNLAAEYYIASLLFRLGYVATVTLGNTKEIDLMVYDPRTQDTVTIDVKGLKTTTDWIMPTKLPEKIARHFYVLVTFKNRIKDLDEIPEIYTIPRDQVPNLLEHWTRKDGKPIYGIKYSKIREHPEFKGKEGIKLLFKNEKVQGCS